MPSHRILHVVRRHKGTVQRQAEGESELKNRRRRRGLQQLQLQLPGGRLPRRQGLQLLVGDQLRGRHNRQPCTSHSAHGMHAPAGSARRRNWASEMREAGQLTRGRRSSHKAAGRFRQLLLLREALRQGHRAGGHGRQALAVAGRPLRVGQARATGAAARPVGKKRPDWPAVVARQQERGAA